jgi:predicted nucleic acid binding AN1-type Zn finger protein
MAGKKRCELQGETPCNHAIIRFAGHCQHCNASFCSNVRISVPSSLFRWQLTRRYLPRSQHRLPEHHNCTNLESCRTQAFERNKIKLESERTVASKMAMA